MDKMKKRAIAEYVGGAILAIASEDDEDAKQWIALVEEWADEVMMPQSGRKICRDIVDVVLGLDEEA